MRTKALLLAAAVAAGGLATAAAQTVYSINTVGYVNMTIPVGFSMIANPLNTTNNTIASLIPNPPEDTAIFKWTGTTFAISQFSFGEWSNPNLTLNPGEGCFIQALTAFTNTFVGEVMQGSLTNAIPAGFSMKASMVPQEGTAIELGFTPPEDTFVYKYNNAQSRFDVFSYSFGEWSIVPTFKVGEAFWVSSPSVGQWVRNFTVNQ